MKDKLYSLIHSFVFNTTEVSDMNLAEYLIANGVKIPVPCIDCSNSEVTTIPGRVWCKRMGRYMKVDGYCSEGE